MKSDARKSAGVVWSFAVTSGVLVAQIVAGKATRDTLLLANFGLRALPAAMIGAALVSSIAMVGISRVLTRQGPARVVPAMFALGAAFFLAEWWLATRDEQLASIAVYVHLAIFGSAGVSSFWSLVNECFDPHSAKQMVGRIASGGTVGGVLGGVVVWRAADHLSVTKMLALLAGINAIGLVAAQTAARAAKTDAARPPIASGKGAAGNTSSPKGGVRILEETPYLRNLALLVALGAVIQALLDWLLSAHATARFGKGAELLAFFAVYNMIVGVASFAAQTGLSRPLLDKLGLAETLKLQPVAVGITSAVTAAFPLFPMVVVLRGVEAVVRNSFYRAAYELCYTPLPASKKRPSKTLIDVGFDRIGTTLGAGALLGVAHLAPETATRAVLFGAVVASAAAWLVSARLHDGYVSALASSLKSGAVALDDDPSLDFTTKKTLAETTALLDRQRLLERIERFQRDKESRAGDEPRSRAGTLDARLATHDKAPASVASSTDVDPISLRADPVLARARSLRSNDVARIKKELGEALEPALAPFVVPLLANDAVVRDAVRALRKIAPRVTGVLLDALVDPEVDPRVRRRVPRVLKVCRTQRAAAGLLLGLSDPVFEVRVQVGLALAEIHAEAGVALERDAIFEVAQRELTSGRATWSQVTTRPEGEGEGEDAPPAPDDELARGLAHVFTILGLVLEREPLSIAYRALRSDDPGLRGTAFEYLEVVLPPRLRDVMSPLLGDVKPAPRSRDRDKRELEGELLKSSAALARPATPSRSSS